MRKCRDRFSEVSLPRCREIEHHRQVALFGEPFSDGVEDQFALCTESSKNQDYFRRERIDQIAEARIDFPLYKTTIGQRL